MKMSSHVVFSFSSFFVLYRQKMENSTLALELKRLKEISALTESASKDQLCELESEFKSQIDGAAEELASQIARLRLELESSTTSLRHEESARMRDEVSHAAAMQELRLAHEESVGKALQTEKYFKAQLETMFKAHSSSSGLLQKEIEALKAALRHEKSRCEDLPDERAQSHSSLVVTIGQLKLQMQTERRQRVEMEKELQELQTALATVKSELEINRAELRKYAS